MKFTVILLVSLALLVLIVFVEQGQRRIPVTFAKRVVGRKMYGGLEHLHPAEGQPGRRDPHHLRQLGAVHPGAAVQRHPLGGLPDLGATTTSPPTSVFYILTYFVFILLFTFFYVYVAFDPHQQADIIRKQGGYIPGIRPGPPDRALPGPHPQPDHLARRPVPRRRWPSPRRC